MFMYHIHLVEMSFIFFFNLAFNGTSRVYFSSFNHFIKLLKQKQIGLPGPRADMGSLCVYWTAMLKRRISICLLYTSYPW